MIDFVVLSRDTQFPFSVPKKTDSVDTHAFLSYPYALSMYTAPCVP